jgi:hypothetical protein
MSSPDLRSSISPRLPDGVSEESLLASMQAVINSLDLEKVARCSPMRMNQMIIDRLGIEKTGRIALMQLLSCDYFFSICEVNSPDVMPHSSDQATSCEKFLLGLAADPMAFQSAFASLRELVNAVAASLPKRDHVRINDRHILTYQYLESLLARIVQPPSLSFAEETLLYPAAFYAHFILAQQPVSARELGQFTTQIGRMVSDILSPETLMGESQEDREHEVCNVQSWVLDWVEKNISIVAV